jgi:hypothetical protein
MPYRDLRPALFRLATALMFVTAVGLFKTGALRADMYFGPCYQIEVPRGCDLDLGGGWGPVCFTEGSCIGGSDLCYCMGDYLCYWWPNGCA